MRSTQTLCAALTIFLAFIFQCNVSHSGNRFITQTGRETIESYDRATNLMTLSVAYSFQGEMWGTNFFGVAPNLIGEASFSLTGIGGCIWVNTQLKCTGDLTSVKISYRYQAAGTGYGPGHIIYKSYWGFFGGVITSTSDLFYPPSLTFIRAMRTNGTEMERSVEEPGHLQWVENDDGRFFVGVVFQINPPERLTLALLPEEPKTVVWANGHEEFMLFAILTKEGGVPVSGRSIQLTANPTIQTIISPAGGMAVTDSVGVASFTVASTKVHEVNFTATHRQGPQATPLTAMTHVRFVERRVAVIVQGTSSSLNPKNDQGIFPEIRDLLVNDLSYRGRIEGIAEARAKCTNTEDDDGDGVPNDGCPLILNYSYLGGSTDVSTGIWQPNDYTCDDTAQDLSESIEQLRLMLKDFSTANPNTRFVIIGHSQGGLITLQGLRFTSLPIDSAIMLAGALGGVPEEIADASGYLPDFVFCWGDPASDQMVQIWNSTNQHNRQGSTARFVPLRNNTGLVRAAQRQGTRVMTIGSTDDCLFNPARCLNVGFSSDNTSTAIVEQADVAILLPLGENCPSRRCSRESHRIVRTHPTVLQMLQEFVGPSLIE